MLQFVQLTMKRGSQINAVSKKTNIMLEPKNTQYTPKKHKKEHAQLIIRKTYCLQKGISGQIIIFI
uniref:Uncharacterized protein n=1 Tax=Rhizophora mucronata TaxID=61149 RepID=A0A2P2NB09_RHIMU